MSFKTVSLQAFVLGISNALVACGGNSAQSLEVPSDTSGVRLPLTSVASRGFLGLTTPTEARSKVNNWVSAEAKTTKTLVFVADFQKGEVLMFSWPKLKSEGTISVAGPAGECSDASGNVWVTSDGSSSAENKIFEYSHSGSLLNTINDTYGYPSSCAVNPTNGALAVINIEGPSGPPGDVLIYATPSSVPTVLTNPDEYLYYFAGYDNKGHLWEDGQDLVTPSSLKFILSKCGASTCKTIKVTGDTIYFPGMVQWNSSARKWVIGDQSCGDAQSACVYSVSPKGAIEGQSKLFNTAGGALCDMIQGTLTDKVLIGEDITCQSDPASVFAWPYPAGGKATKTNDNGMAAPDGIALSTE